MTMFLRYTLKVNLKIYMPYVEFTCKTWFSPHCRSTDGQSPVRILEMRGKSLKTACEI